MHNVGYIYVHTYIKQLFSEIGGFNDFPNSNRIEHNMCMLIIIKTNDQPGVGLMVPSLDSQMDDSIIEFQIGRIDGNFPGDFCPTAD